MGNEEGVMPLPSWACATADGTNAGAAAGSGGGSPLQDAYMPPSSDAVLREHYWFYQNQTENHTKSAKVRTKPSRPRSWANFSLVYHSVFPQECMGRYSSFGLT